MYKSVNMQISIYFQEKILQTYRKWIGIGYNKNMYEKVKKQILNAYGKLD